MGLSINLKRYIAFFLMVLANQIFFASNAFAGRIEAGAFNAHNTFGDMSERRVNFQQTFDVVPIVVAISDQRGGDSASIRITNVTTTGFDELILETDNFDGRHVDQTVQYIAIEPGRHVLPSGAVIEAGFTDTAATQFGSGVAGTASFANISFSKPLQSIPSVISHLQTANSETRNVASQASRPHITALSINPAVTGFQLALERSQANSGPIPSVETVGWIAFPAGQTGNLPDISGVDVTWSSVNTGANIRGSADGCFTNSFGQISAAPVVVAKKNTRNNPDGGWLRYCSLSSTEIGVFVEEDRDQDTERNVAAINAESVSIIAFSRSFHSELTVDINISKISESFVDTIGSGGFALPNSTFDYVINISNSGNSRPNFDTVIAVDSLPDGVAFIIDDIGGAGSGPIAFSDGSVPSDLFYVFNGLSNTADSLEFSTDGSNFNHVPVDSGDGTDPSITHIRVTLLGAMAPRNAGIGSSLTLRFKTKVR